MLKMIQYKISTKIEYLDFIQEVIKYKICDTNSYNLLIKLTGLSIKNNNF